MQSSSEGGCGALTRKVPGREAGGRGGGRKHRQTMGRRQKRMVAVRIVPGGFGAPEWAAEAAAAAAARRSGNLIRGMRFAICWPAISLLQNKNKMRARKRTDARQFLRVRNSRSSTKRKTTDYPKPAANLVSKPAPAVILSCAVSYTRIQNLWSWIL